MGVTVGECQLVLVWFRVRGCGPCGFVGVVIAMASGLLGGRPDTQIEGNDRRSESLRG